MFERFTDRARRVVVLAQEEARMLNHNYIGTEHILLGLIHEGEGVAAKALESLGISLEAVRQQVEEIIGQGQHEPLNSSLDRVGQLALCYITGQLMAGCGPTQYLRQPKQAGQRKQARHEPRGSSTLGGDDPI